MVKGLTRRYRRAPSGDGRPPPWYAPHRAIIAQGLILTAVAVDGGIAGVVNSARAGGAIPAVSDRHLRLTV